MASDQKDVAYLPADGEQSSIQGSSWGDNPSFRTVTQALKVWADNSALNAISNAVKGLEFGSTANQLAQMARTWEQNSALNTAAFRGNLEAFSAMGDLQKSPLWDYLASSKASDLSRLVEAGGIASASATLMGEAAAFKGNLVLEEEIVRQLSVSYEPERLPAGALSHLHAYVRYLTLLIKCFVFCVSVVEAYAYVVDKLEGVKSPEDVRQTVSALPEEHRLLLSDYRILTRDRVILRSSPSKKSDDLGRLQIGTLVQVLDASGAWIKVSVEIFDESLEGWVYRGFTAAIPPPKK